jgi:hypothetical protein
MTTHPAHSAHKLAANLAAIQLLLTDSKNDEKATVINMIKKAQDTLKELRKQMNEQERKRQVAQQMFCDKLTFEFSVNADFSDSYIRSYDDMITDCETIKSIVYSERQLQNMSDEHLFSRVTILDTDPEA